MGAADLANMEGDWAMAIEYAWNDDGTGNNSTYGGVPVVFDIDVMVGTDACLIGDNCVGGIAADLVKKLIDYGVYK